MSFKCVGDIMVPLDEYPHLPHWFTLRQALAELKNAQYTVGDKIVSPRTVLVFDEAYRLLGQLSRRDILRGMEPRFLTSDPARIKFHDLDMRPDPGLVELSFDQTVKGFRERSERKISGVMRPIVTTLEFEDPLMKAMAAFDQDECAVIPVLKQGMVAGIVNTLVLFHELEQLLLV